MQEIEESNGQTDDLKQFVLEIKNFRKSFTEKEDIVPICSKNHANQSPCF